MSLKFVSRLHERSLSTQLNGNPLVPGFDRRSFLRFSLGAGAAALSSPCRAGAEQVDPKQDSGRAAKAVILLWMAGGPSQIETWDPKPGSRNAGEFKAIDTTGGPIMKFSELLRICGTQGRHLNLIRSMATHETSHVLGTSLMHLGLAPVKSRVHPALGTVVSYEKGRKDFLLPHFIAIDPPAIPEAPIFGEDFLPFVLRDADSPLEKIKDWAALRQQKGLVKADDVMSSPQLKAFNLQDEPAELRKQYGARFGLNCLLARRLVEAGCSFVEVGLGDWDMHADVAGNCRRVVPTLDAGLGTLIKDLAEKDLLQETLVICTGEFGRTPTLNAGRGRDDYADGFTVVLAGGGLAGGRVTGDTGPNGDTSQNPVLLHALFSTIYKACGIDGNKTYKTDGRSFKYSTYGGDPSRHAAPLKDLF
jgi:hypothetical protein